MDRSSAEGALVEAPKAPTTLGCGEGVCPPRRGRGIGRRLDPSPEIILLFDLKMEHFGAVFKLDLAEETRNRRKQLPPLASFRLRMCWLQLPAVGYETLNKTKVIPDFLRVTTPKSTRRC